MNIVCAAQAALDRRRELDVVQIDFSAAFDRVSHSDLLHKLRDVGVGGSVFDVIAGFLSGRVQRGLMISAVGMLLWFPVFLRVARWVSCCFCCTRVICR